MDVTERFSNRAQYYANFRPGYPRQVLETMRRECGLTPKSVIADVGCGTGLLARQLCSNGNIVYGVEPNPAMLEEAKKLLLDCATFVPVHGRAEATSLKAGLVDIITVAQAFHWFHVQEARREFERILKPKGWVVLLRNERRTEASAFNKDYEQLLMRFGVDYHQVRARNKESLPEFFGKDGFKKTQFRNPQLLDRNGLTGRILSASYIPQRGHENYPPMLGAIDNLFDEHQKNGVVKLEQDTRMFYGHLT